WDRLTGKKLATDFEKGVDEISYLTFSKDGSCLLVAEGEKRIRVLDRVSRNELAVIRPANGFLQVALSPDNERILTASANGRSQIWAPVHIKSDVTDTLGHAHNDIVIQASFSSDGSRIVTASYDKTVKVWDTESQKLLVVFRKHTHELLKADFSPDSQRIVSVDSRGVSRVWDSWTGDEIFHQPFSSDRFLKSAESKNGLRGILLENVAGLSSNPFSPSAKEPKVVVNSDQGLLVRQGVDGRDSFLLKESQNVAWPVIDPSGTLVAAITDALDVINVWDLNTGELNYTLKGHKSVAFWAEFSRDGKRIVTGSSDKTAIVWDASDGAMLLPPLVGHKNFVAVARFSPDGERIATLGFDNEVLIWNARTGEHVSTLKGAERRVTNLEFNPDLGVSRVLTTAADNVVLLWDPSGPFGREVLQITRDSKLIYAKWSPDGRTILSCWKDGVVRLYKTIPMDAFAEITDANDMVDQLQQWRAIQN
ncbi:MAG: WD40 repeat domain-containing protein, partial [Verrucomicrobia bacterium]|nr:WD40 repeat domain-containing protein [Verrucomicrobiota bacterium]